MKKLSLLLFMLLTSCASMNNCISLSGGKDDMNASVEWCFSPAETEKAGTQAYINKASGKKKYLFSEELVAKLASKLAMPQMSITSIPKEPYTISIAPNQCKALIHFANTD